MTSSLFNSSFKERVEDLLTVPVHPTDYKRTVESIASWIRNGEGPARYIVQANVNSIVVAQENELYAKTLHATDLCVPDGMPLVWMLRWRGHPIRTRVYGPDLMLLLCEEAAKRGWRCFLYGGKEGVPEELAAVLQAKFPGLQIVGTYSPPFRTLTPEEDEAVCRMINATQPDIVWVGLGAPNQDIWMYEHRDKLNASVLHGVGAAFDFLTGRVRQAPRWMMEAGLEWLFRLFQEPTRLWKRYTVTNVKFFYYLLRSIFVNKNGKRKHE